MSPYLSNGPDLKLIELPLFVSVENTLICGEYDNNPNDIEVIENSESCLNIGGRWELLELFGQNVQELNNKLYNQNLPSQRV